jgi:hypothetical protein
MDNLNFELERPFGMSADHFQHVIEGYEREMGYELFRNLRVGKIYSAEVRRTSQLDGLEGVERVRVSLHVGEADVRHLALLPKARRLGLVERLRVLFTGWMPLEIG